MNNNDVTWKLHTSVYIEGFKEEEEEEEEEEED